MIRANLSYDTKHFQTYRKEGSVTVFDKAYCVYCGKEIQPDTEIDHHETCDYYHCDCEDAKKEIALQQLHSPEQDARLCIVSHESIVRNSQVLFVMSDVQCPYW